MAPPETIWHKESLNLKEIFGTREGFKICPYQLFQALIKASSGMCEMVCAGGCGGGGESKRKKPGCSFQK